MIAFFICRESKIMQRRVWDKIADAWKKFRVKPLPEISEFLKEDKGIVLDIGCGSGRNFISGRKYVGIDFSKAMIINARKHEDEKNIILGVAEAESLPFKDGSFSTVLLLAVLHSSRNRKQIVGEMFRVMDRGGRAIISVWNRNQPRFKNEGTEAFVPWKQNGEKVMRYYHLYTEDELKEELQDKFKILKLWGSREKAQGVHPKNIMAVVEKEWS
jgi:tRNA (uracil-5-)-methyltransferase TRM9